MKAINFIYINYIHLFCYKSDRWSTKFHQPCKVLPSLLDNMNFLKMFAILTCISAYSISGISRRSRLKGDIFFQASRAQLQNEIGKIWPGQLKMWSRKSRPKPNNRGNKPNNRGYNRLQRFRNHHRKN